MPVVLKVKDGSELHRILLEDSDLTFDAVFEVVKGVHNSEGMAIKYLDEDEDLCTLCRSSFSDFWNTATVLKGRKVLKVEVFQAPTSMNSASPSASHSCAVAASMWPEVPDNGVPGPPQTEAAVPKPSLVSDGSSDMDETATQAPAATFNEQINPEEAAQSEPVGVNGLTRFTQQVVQDFKTSNEDMKHAFTSDNQLSTVAGATLGAVVGAVVAARLMPVRLTRLAADTVATSSGTTRLEQEEPPTPQQENGPHHADDEVTHFKQSVTHDFTSAHSEVSGALRDLVRAGHNFCGSQADSDRCVLPAIAGGLAGTLVAATLVPVRGVRLVVAKMSGVHSTSSTGPEATPQQRMAESSMSQEVVSDSDMMGRETSEAPSTGASAADWLRCDENDASAHPASSENNDC